MGGTLAAIVSTFGLAFFWFIGAIPAGAALGLPVPLAALTAWASYSAGAAVVALAGVPLRAWLTRRLKLPTERDPNKLIWRVWDRYGLIGLALLAPVTVGSQAAALIGLSLGEAPARLILALALGGGLWSAGIALAVALGVQVAGGA